MSRPPLPDCQGFFKKCWLNDCKRSQPCDILSAPVAFPPRPASIRTQTRS